MKGKKAYFFAIGIFLSFLIIAGYAFFLIYDLKGDVKAKFEMQDQLVSRYIEQDSNSSFVNQLSFTSTVQTLQEIAKKGGDGSGCYKSPDPNPDYIIWDDACMQSVASTIKDKVSTSIASKNQPFLTNKFKDIKSPMDGQGILTITAALLRIPEPISSEKDAPNKIEISYSYTPSFTFDTKEIFDYKDFSKIYEEIKKEKGDCASSIPIPECIKSKFNSDSALNDRWIIDNVAPQVINEKPYWFVDFSTKKSFVYINDDKKAVYAPITMKIALQQ